MTQIGDRIMTALGILQRDGWCKYELQNSQGQRCAVGALIDTQQYSMVNSPVLMALADHIPADFDFPAAWRRAYGSVYSYEYASAWNRCALYNNTRSSFDEIEEWFTKTALDEGISLS